MRKSKFAELQRVAIFKKQESGISIEELVRKHVNPLPVYA